MKTNFDGLAYALHEMGKRYLVGPTRCEPNSPYHDCSGLVKATATVLGVVNFPTVSQSQLNALIPCSFAVAVRTPLAVLGHDGWGPNGHIVFSRGDGTSVEARGTRYGVGSWSLYGRNLNRCGFMPGVQYLGHNEPPPAGGLYAVAAALRALAVKYDQQGAHLPIIRIGSHGQDVSDWQFGLIGTSGARIQVDGDFGPKTQAATLAYQRFMGLQVDGVVGPQSRHSMAALLHTKYG